MAKRFFAVFAVCIGLCGSIGAAIAQNSPEAKALAAQFVDQNRSPMDRLAALHKLRAVDPALADKFEPTRQKLVPLATKQAAEAMRQIDSINSVMGIKVGMTAEQVRNARYWVDQSG